MAVGSVQNTSTLNNQQSSTTSALTGNQAPLGKDAFMKLLIAQLKNQDPLNPTDAKEFVTQLSQLTSVETMSGMSDKLASLNTATASLVANQATSLVGKKIEGDGKTLYLGDLGSANTSINLDKGSKDVTVKVLDSTGTVVKTVKQNAAMTPMGISPFSWDGKLENGDRAPAGKYTISVEAKDSSGNAIVADAKISGVVTSVSYERGFPELIVGNTSVALANITKISNATEGK